MQRQNVPETSKMTVEVYGQAGEKGEQANEAKVDEFLDSTGNDAKDVLDDIAQAAAEVKIEALKILEGKAKARDQTDEVAKSDGAKESNENELIDQAGKVAQQLMDEAGKAAFDVKERATTLLDADTDDEGVGKEGEKTQPKELLDKAGKVAQHVLDEAGKAASDIKERAIDLLDAETDEEKEQAERVAREAAKAEMKKYELLDKAAGGKAAQNVPVDEASKAASDVKERAVDLVGADTDEKKDQGAGVGKEGEKTQPKELLDKAGKAAQHVMDEASKAASDMKERAIDLMDAQTDEEKEHAERVAREAAAAEPENNSMLDRASKAAHYVMDEAGKAASDVKERATSLVSGAKTEEENRGDEAAKELNEDESEDSSVLDKAGKVAQRVMDQAGRTASSVKEGAMNLLDRNAEEKQNGDSSTEADKAEQENNSMLDKASKAAKFVMEGAGKAASDMKKGAIQLMDTKTKTEGPKNETAGTESASN